MKNSNIKKIEEYEKGLKDPEKVRRKRVWIRRGILLGAALLILLGVLFGKKAVEHFQNPNAFRPTPSIGLISKENADSTAVENGAVFLSVGEGASVLFCTEGHAVLLDGGDRSHAQEVCETLPTYGVTKLDLVIASHYDADHIGGLITVLERFPVDMVWGPDYVAETETYKRFFTVISEKQIPFQAPMIGTQFTVGRLVLSVLGPVLPQGAPKDTKSMEQFEISENDYSLVVRASIDGVSVLLPGDTTKSGEQRLMNTGADLLADVLYVAHHGSGDSGLATFLKRVGANYAILSVGENDYGHPHKACLERLAKQGMAVYRTDEFGTIRMRIEAGRPVFEAAER